MQNHWKSPKFLDIYKNNNSIKVLISQVFGFLLTVEYDI